MTIAIASAATASTATAAASTADLTYDRDWIESDIIAAKGLIADFQQFMSERELVDFANSLHQVQDKHHISHCIAWLIFDR